METKRKRGPRAKLQMPLMSYVVQAMDGPMKGQRVSVVARDSLAAIDAAGVPSGTLCVVNIIGLALAQGGAA